MSKKKVSHVCQECGYETPKWVGRCPSCGNWNTIVEEVVAPPQQARRPQVLPAQKPLPIQEVDVEDAPRFSSGSTEFDRVLGQGMVPGSVLLIVGDPGVGKSSLLLQVCAHVATTRGTVLYVTGEESARQVRMRADRLSALSPSLHVLSETNLDLVQQHVTALAPELLVIDSIQTLFWPEVPSAPGSVSQVRECAHYLLQLAKSRNMTTAIIGHVTKDGGLAGPRVLEHIVDSVLYFEGDHSAQHRVLRAVKNRFGSTNEIGLFEMRDSGLLDVPDASSFFLSERPERVPGSVVVPTLEGSRTLLVEIQALVTGSAFGSPRRAADGIDVKRVLLVTAVLEKRAGLLLADHDAYVKVAGGLSVDEPAIDLGLLVALASSFRERATDPDAVVFGEVGLAGEVRAVTQAEKRVREAQKMGFRKVVLPRGNMRTLVNTEGIELVAVETVNDALSHVFIS